MTIISRRCFFKLFCILSGTVTLSLIDYKTAGSIERIGSLNSSVNNNRYPSIDWDYLNLINSDVCGWISIPKTNVSQPIVRAVPGNPGFYLSHRWDKAPDSAGSVSLDEDCRGDLFAEKENHISVLYAHAMNDGSMFSDIVNYLKASWAKEHASLFLQTPDNVVEYKHAFTEVIDGAEAAKQCCFPNREAYRSWLFNRREKAVLAMHESIHDHALILCTCSYTTYANERTLAYFFPVTTQERSDL